jgi:3-hydroxyacyl-CoA dehydrogenase
VRVEDVLTTAARQLPLIDMIGLDVTMAIAERLGLDVPAGLRELVKHGRLGRKPGQASYAYR